MLICEQCYSPCNNLTHGLCDKCSNIGGGASAKPIDTSHALFRIVYGEFVYIPPQRLTLAEAIAAGFTDDIKSAWPNTSIPDHAMPASRPDTKAFNKRDKARSIRHMRAIKESDLDGSQPEITDKPMREGDKASQFDDFMHIIRNK